MAYKLNEKKNLGEFTKFFDECEQPKDLRYYVNRLTISETFKSDTKRVTLRLHENAPDYVADAFYALIQYLNEIGEEKDGAAPMTKPERDIRKRIAELSK